MDLCGDGLLIATLSQTLFLSSLLQENQIKKVGKKFEFAAIRNSVILNVTSATSMNLSFHL